MAIARTASTAGSSSLLLGNQTVEPTADSNPAGTAEAFPFTALSTGHADSISVYLDSHSTAKTVVLGIYTDVSGNPGARLASAALASPQRGAWNSIALPSTSITAGARYWLAILGEGRMVFFRDRTTANLCQSQTSHQQTLTSLPLTWSTGVRWASCSISASIEGTISPTPTTGSATPPATLTVPTAAPVNSAAPQVSGGATVGQTLTTTSGGWTGSPTAYSYQWQECDSAGLVCQNIVNANSSSYVVAPSDVGSSLRADVTATNAGGSTSAPSDLTAPVATQPAPVNSGLPQITGSTTQGQTLTASHGSWTNSPTSFTFQWQDCDASGLTCSNISGATGDTYALTSGDVLHTLRVVVTAANAGGWTPAVSTATAAVTSSSSTPPSNTAPPQVSGTPTQGQSLTATDGAWTPAPTSYAHQWEDCDTSGANCATIPGATSKTYTLSGTDVGHTVRAVVTATDAGGSASSISVPTAVVASSAPAPPANTAAPGITGSTTQGQVLTTTTGTWTGNPTSYAYQWQDCNSTGGSCSNVAGATSASYTLTASDTGSTMRAVVTATNAGGSASAASAATATVAGGGAVGSPSAAIVGASGEPPVTCSTTLNPGANVQNALAAAASGQVVCLNGGNWPTQTLSGVSHSGMVTLAATPGSTVTINGMSITGQTNNLTVEGMKWSAPFQDRAGVNNVIFQYNTLENLPNQFAVYSYPQSVGGNGVANGMQVLYNQFDHIGSCVEIDGGSGMQQNWTISHNVCGPDVGDGISSANDPSHYIQIGGVSGVTIDNNAFEGPYDSQGINDGPHNNVIHVWGTQSNIDIENNLIWHTDSRAQTILIEEGTTNNVTIKNNLDVEDPANFTNSNIYAMGWDVNHSHGETVVNNTAVSPYWGTMDGVLYQSNSGDYASTTGQTVKDNIVVPKASGGNANFNTSCASSCAYASNISGDSSAPGSGSTLNWTPSWQTTSWTPNSGAPWNPPPAGYYKPVGLASTVGYQGSIGP